MRLRRSLFTAGLLVLLLTLGLLAAPRGPLHASAADTVALRTSIQRIIEDDDLPSAIWGVYVHNLRTGEVVYSRNADVNLVPASNLKLVTTAVALDALGPNYRYATRLYFDGAARDSTLRGDLILRGSADPTFGSALSGKDPLREWAQQLRALGVRRIEGRLIGDDDAIDDLPYADGWDISHIATEDWAQSVGGLSYADNLVNVQIAGTTPGQPARVQPQPGGYVQVKSTLTTRGRRGYNPLRIRRTVGTNEVLVDGSVSAGYRGTARLPIQDPTAFTLHAFAERLRAAGIELDVQIVDADELAEQLNYDDEPILVHLSPPLLEILTQINEKSNNFYAEQVFRTFAGGGTTAGGERRVFAFLEAAGIPTTGLSIRDGSGLSRKNLITPETLGRLLAHMYRHEQRDAFLSTLPQGGQPGTTLRYRLAGLRAFAKTGTLEHVRTLSGYVAGRDGTPYVFVLFANNYTSRSSLVAVAQNEIVQAIASGGRG